VRRYLAFTAELPQTDPAQRRNINKLRQRYAIPSSNLHRKSERAA
jgi:hypothetical protein